MKLAIALVAVAAMQAQVRVEKTTWHGWRDAVILRNPVAAVVIVPSIGRVMQFSFLEKNGQPGEGPFWNNRMLDGRPVDPLSNQWSNFGGDKSWPAPQADWPGIMRRAWPPPTGFDAAEDRITIEGSQVTLTSPIDPAFGLQEHRTINLDNSAPVMTISTTYEKVAGTPVNVGVWTITQLNSPDNVYAEVPAKTIFPTGYTNLSTSAIFELSREADRIRLRRDPEKSTKLGTDGSWLIWNGPDASGDKISLKIERTSVPEADAEWPDNGSRVEVYTNPDQGGQHYVELEVMGPLHMMQTGDHATTSIRYTLTRGTAK
jgi:hypothetical protein